MIYSNNRFYLDSNPNYEVYKYKIYNWYDDSVLDVFLNGRYTYVVLVNFNNNGYSTINGVGAFELLNATYQTATNINCNNNISSNHTDSTFPTNTESYKMRNYCEFLGGIIDIRGLILNYYYQIIFYIQAPFQGAYNGFKITDVNNGTSTVLDYYANDYGTIISYIFQNKYLYSQSFDFAIPSIGLGKIIINAISVREIGPNL
jgi:hypothetical protein